VLKSAIKCDAFGHMVQNPRPRMQNSAGRILVA